MMSAGAEAPAEKLRARISWPATESTSPRNVSPVVWLVSIQPTLIASTSSTAVPASHTARGRCATRSPTRRQNPCVSSLPVWPTCGIVSSPGDQNALRPVIASSAGSTVSIEIIASAIPTAPTGPSPLARWDALLLERVAVAQGHGGVLGGLAVDRHPERRADLVLAAVALADRAAGVVLGRHRGTRSSS